MKTTPTDPAFETTLARLADAATPGPWIKSTRGCDAMISTEALGFLFPALGNSEGAHQDAEFIAAANPSAIKSLLARIESQGRALDVATKSLASIRQLSLGRDCGSSAWQAQCASELSEKGIKEINAILGGENNPRDLPRSG